jgi:hypothetical protein
VPVAVVLAVVLAVNMQRLLHYVRYAPQVRRNIRARRKKKRQKRPFNFRRASNFRLIASLRLAHPACLHRALRTRPIGHIGHSNSSACLRGHPVQFAEDPHAHKPSARSQAIGTLTSRPHGHKVARQQVGFACNHGFTCEIVALCGHSGHETDGFTRNRNLARVSGPRRAGR